MARIIAAASLMILLISTTMAHFAADVQSNCPDDFASPLKRGQIARVSPGDSNRVRSDPATTGELLGTLPGGYVFLVVNGPVCSDGLVWWEIYTAYQDGGVIGGWTAEGRSNEYWLEPISNGWDCNWPDTFWENVSLSFSFLADQSLLYDFHEAAILAATCVIDSDTEFARSGFKIRGDAYYGSGNYSAAVDDYTEYIRFTTEQGWLNATHVGLVGRAKAYLSLGDTQAATADINAVLGVTNDYHALVVQGQIFRKLGNYNDSISSFLAAMQRYAENEYGSFHPLEARLGLGDVYSDQRRYVEAVEQYSRAAYEYSSYTITTEADYVEIAIRLAQVYDVLGIHEQALGAFQLYLAGMEEKNQSPDANALRRTEELQDEGIQPFNFLLVRPNLETLRARTFESPATSFEFAVSIDTKCSLAWSPDGQWLVANGMVLSPDNPQFIPYFIPDALPWSVAFHPDSVRMLASSSTGELTLLNIVTGETLKTWDGYSHVVISPDGKHFVSQVDAGIIVRDLQTGHEVYSLPISRVNDPSFNWASDSEYSPDGRLLAFSFGDFREFHFDLYNATDGQFLRRINTFGNVEDIAFSPNGKFIIATERESISMWDVETGLFLGFFGLRDSLTDTGEASLSSDGSLLAATRSHTLVVYDVNGGDVVASFPEEGREQPHCIAFHPRDNRVAAIFDDNSGETHRLHIIDIDNLNN
jgi:WD40 repeat protein